MPRFRPPSVAAVRTDGMASVDWSALGGGVVAKTMSRNSIDALPRQPVRVRAMFNMFAIPGPHGAVLGVEVLLPLG
jgi:hypothetical protein